MSSTGPPGRAATGGALRAALDGAIAAAIAAGAGIALALIAYLVLGRPYRLWTWIKVGFLYLLSFCGVEIRADAFEGTFPGPPLHLVYRFPLWVGTALVVACLLMVGRRVARDTRSVSRRALAALAAVAGFAVPVALVSLSVRLVFPDIGGAVVTPIRWQAAVLPGVVAAASVAAGIYLESRRASPRSRLAAWLEGAFTMTWTALALAFVGFLILAAVKPSSTATYARAMGAAGHTGGIIVVHHALMLPAQSLWILAPSMGGVTEVGLGLGDRSRVVLSGIDLGAGAATLVEGSKHPRVPLGGGFYVFLLVPMVASVWGGRRAAAGSGSIDDAVVAGAGAGVAFAIVMGVAAWFSRAAVPIPPRFPAPVSIVPSMPSTALLALVWGVLGGTLGALSTRWIGARAVPQDEGGAPGVPA